MKFEQLNIFGGVEYLSSRKKKYVSPDYLKFYSLYQYDREKFKVMLREAKEKKPPASLEEDIKLQNEILNACYIRDKKGQKIRDCDEAHILRIGTLQKIYEKIFDYTGVMSLDDEEKTIILKQYGLTIYPFEAQAEIEGTWQESIKDRLKVHIKLLRFLRKGFSVSESIRRLNYGK